MISRRKVLAIAGAMPAWLALKGASSATEAILVSDATPERAQDSGPLQNDAILEMGGTPASMMQHFMNSRSSPKPFDLIEYCHSIGLKGIQFNPPSTDAKDVKQFRQRLEDYGMHLVCDPRLDWRKIDLQVFENDVIAYKEAGASSFHAAFTGRRYEDFDQLGPFKDMFEAIKKTVEQAEPILRRHRMKLGIENHKGYRSEEHAAWLKKLGSEWVGVCLDFGNNISLCEDPVETARTLAPYTVNAHVKDMAVEEYEGGFLLSEVPLGEGVVDLKKIVEICRRVDSRIIFNLEMITRDPLKIPVFTEKYWVTFDDVYSPLPGRDLAKTLNLVKNNPPPIPLARTGNMSPEERIQFEDSNLRKSVEYARKNLNL